MRPVTVPIALAWELQFDELYSPEKAPQVAVPVSVFSHVASASSP
jgi:hypothetical protein